MEVPKTEGRGLQASHDSSMSHNQFADPLEEEIIAMYHQNPPRIQCIEKISLELGLDLRSASALLNKIIAKHIEKNTE